MAQRVSWVNLLNGRNWSPKQVEALTATTPEVYIDAGRQFGKSYVGAARFVLCLVARINAAAAAIERGELAPWAGIGKPRAEAVLEPPTVQAWVLTPREKHLTQCRGYIREYFQGAAAHLLHPDPKMRVRMAGREMWLLHRGVGVKISFAPASGWTSVTGFGIDLLWIDEAGLFDSTIFDAVLPLLWAKDGELIATGTPEQRTDHWFVQGCISGLGPDHPYYVHDVVKPSDRVTTITGTSYEAYSETVRRRAKIDAQKRGKAWETLWIYADWRLPDRMVYDEWDPRHHVVEYDPTTYRITIDETTHRLPRPSSVYGVIDFNYGSGPGAAVVYHVWGLNPLDPDRGQPLIVAVEDAEDSLQYNKHGWYKVFSRWHQTYRIQRWWCDPSNPALHKTVNRDGRLQGWGRVDPAGKGDKMGRITLVKSVMNRAENGLAAFYVSSQCKVLPGEIEHYEFKLDSQKNPTDKPQAHNDHTLDCCAFLAGEVVPRGFRVPGQRPRLLAI